MPEPHVVLVTGVSSGIGRATAERLSKEGYRVFGTARDPATAPSIPGASLVALDVTDEASVRSCIASVLREAGRIDILINNAGSTILAAVEETAVASAQALFDANLFGTLRMIQAVLPGMRERGFGRIVNVSSVLGFLPAPFWGLYAASKHAVEGLSESLDHEVRGFGIRVALVPPTFTRTKLGAHAEPAAHRVAAYDAPRQRATNAIDTSIRNGAEPAAVADAILVAIRSTRFRRVLVGGQGKLLAGLRTWAPAWSVDAAIRKTFNL